MMGARERVARLRELRNGHAAGIALAHRFNTDPPACRCHGSTTAHRSETVAAALHLCAHMRRHLAQELTGGAR